MTDQTQKNDLPTDIAEEFMATPIDETKEPVVATEQAPEPQPEKTVEEETIKEQPKKTIFAKPLVVETKTPKNNTALTAAQETRKLAAQSTAEEIVLANPTMATLQAYNPKWAAIAEKIQSEMDYRKPMTIVTAQRWVTEGMANDSLEFMDQLHVGLPPELLKEIEIVHNAIDQRVNDYHKRIDAEMGEDNAVSEVKRFLSSIPVIRKIDKMIQGHLEDDKAKEERLEKEELTKEIDALSKIFEDTAKDIKRVQTLVKTAQQNPELIDATIDEHIESKKDAIRGLLVTTVALNTYQDKLNSTIIPNIQSKIEQGDINYSSDDVTRAKQAIEYTNSMQHSLTKACIQLATEVAIENDLRKNNTSVLVDLVGMETNVVPSMINSLSVLAVERSTVSSYSAKRNAIALEQRAANATVEGLERVKNMIELAGDAEIKSGEKTIENVHRVKEIFGEMNDWARQHTAERECLRQQMVQASSELSEITRQFALDEEKVKTNKLPTRENLSLPTKKRKFEL